MVSKNLSQIPHETEISSGNEWEVKIQVSKQSPNPAPLPPPPPPHRPTPPCCPIEAEK